MLGIFQQTNAATAILTLEPLGPALRPAHEAIETGLSRVSLAGRMEYFPAHPGVVFDVAHNPDKASHLAQSLKREFPDRRFSFVIAVGESKDAGEILHAFAACRLRLRSRHSRRRAGLPPNRLGWPVWPRRSASGDVQLPIPSKRLALRGAMLPPTRLSW